MAQVRPRSGRYWARAAFRADTCPVPAGRHGRSRSTTSTSSPAARASARAPAQRYRRPRSERAVGPCRPKLTRASRSDRPGGLTVPSGRDAMCVAMCSASLPTPRRPAARPVHKGRTARRNTGPAVIPRCRDRVLDLPLRRTGRSIQAKSGTKPVHQITLATSRARPPSSTGRPSRTPTVLGTRSMPAAAMSFALTRASGMPRERNCSEPSAPSASSWSARARPRTRSA